MRRIGAAVGVDMQRAFADRERPQATAQVEGAKSEAEDAGVSGTPTLLIFRSGSAEPKRLQADEVELEDVTEALDEALAGG
jgi:hypothetical protein